MLSLVNREILRKPIKRTLSNGANTRDKMLNSSYLIPNIYPFSGKIGIICGETNIAGYGYALAMHLFDNNYDVKLLLVSKKFTNDGRYYFEECLERKIPYEIINDYTDFSTFYILIDALLNSDQDIKENYQEIIDRVNKVDKTVISLDLNSGINLNNGLGNGIKSNLTIAFNNYTFGHFLGNAKDLIKRKILIDLGSVRYSDYKLIEKSDLKPLLKNRLNHSNKGDYGLVTIMGGSLEFSGAIKLSNLALSSLLAGCGVSRVAIPKSIVNGVMPYMLESTLSIMKDKDGKMIFDKESIDNALKKCKCLVIGSGWNRSKEYNKIIEYILENYSINIVMDADALNTLAEMDLDILNETKSKIVLTPHLKEFSRLIDKDIKDIEENIVSYSKEFAKKYHIVLLLKGPTTIITDGEKVYFVDKGTSGMATAGSGDVLSGILGGILSYLDVDILSVSLGAYINGLAGELAEKDTNNISMLSTDTIRFIAKAISEIKE